MQRRTRKLVDLRLQILLTSWFLGVSALSTVLGFFAVSARASRLALELPNDGALFMQGWAQLVTPTMLGVLGLSLSLTLVTGIVVIHRVAGPLYRMRRFLEQVARGERPADCSLRTRDELKDFCESLNRATAPLRRREDEQVVESDAKRAA